MWKKGWLLALLVLIIPIASAITTINEPVNNTLYTYSENINLSITTDITSPSCEYYILNYSNQSAVSFACSTDTSFNVLRDGNYTLNVSASNSTNVDSVLTSIEVYRGEFNTGKILLLGITIFMLLGIGMLLFFIVSKLNEEHTPLKIAFIFITIYFTMLAFQTAYLSITEFVKVNSIVNSFSNYWFIFLMIFVLIVGWFMVYFTKKALELFKSSKI